jgi:hypothetical protein
MRFLTCITRLSIPLIGVKSEFLAFGLFQAMLSFLEYEEFASALSSSKGSPTLASESSSSEIDEDDVFNTGEDDLFAESPPSSPEVSGIIPN